MNKLTFAEIKKMFCEINDNKTEHKEAVVVITEDTFSQPYTLEERSYKFSSDNKMFKSWCGGYSLFASSLDGSDMGVRLERYLDCEGGNWKVDYCYLV